MIKKSLIIFLPTIVFFTSLFHNIPQGFSKVLELDPNEPIKIKSLSGTPLSNAQVIFGNGPLSQDSLIQTNENGEFLPPEGWNQPEMITIKANGYVLTSFVSEIPMGQTYWVRAAAIFSEDSKNIATLTGQATGFNIRNGDGLMDFALIMPLFTQEDLFNFDISLVISPEVDKISAFGQEISIPKNVSLPRQKEYYSFLPITLDKPDYTMKFSSSRTQKIYTTKGQFPFNEVASGLNNNKEFYELINYFDIQGGSLRTVALELGKTTTLNPPVTELSFNTNSNYKAPPCENDEVYLTIPLSKTESFFYPTDTKLFNCSETRKLKFSGKSNESFLLSVLKNKNDFTQSDRLTAFLVPYLQAENQEIFPLIPNPQVSNLYTVSVQNSVRPRTVQPLVTHYTLFALTQNRQSSPVWDVYGLNWVNHIELPRIPLSYPGLKKWRWTASFYAGTKNPLTSSVTITPNLMNLTTHILQSSTDF